MQSGILPRGLYKNKPQLVLHSFFLRPEWCIVCLLCVSCVLSLCHFARKKMRLTVFIKDIAKPPLYSGGIFLLILLSLVLFVSLLWYCLFLCNIIYSLCLPLGNFSHSLALLSPYLCDSDICVSLTGLNL